MAVTKGTVRKLADEKSFERGERYFAAGQVRRLTVDGSTVTATVDGTRTYRVRLDVTPKALSGRCSCPYGADGVFCKHCVATSLAWLEQGGEVEKPRAKPLSDKRLRLFLRGCDQEWLIEQLMTAAKSDRVLRARLAAAAGQKNAFDDRDTRARLERAIDIPDFIDYGGAYGYFLHVGEALDEVGRLVGAGFADAAITLAEYALELLESSAERWTTPTVGCPRRSPAWKRSTCRRARRAHRTRWNWPSVWSRGRVAGGTGAACDPRLVVCGPICPTAAASNSSVWSACTGW
ncbi:SWIM zinc finger family protein [Lentzea sp. CC55]|uniref:SWIM zinc finger family protein n=1 Tax=Lentzea sp. CC55 TaxID=2884909 RepID=UPI0027E0AE89|nr:SWIM zinc finger family protein [Lentzea sp. CC55]MCG8921437.1 SWIM zinc finger family protein [Lentzea sp. CC55]